MSTNTSKPKIVVLGGSFNPPTLAHQKLLLTAVRTLKAETGLFVPSSDRYVSRKMSKQRSYNMVYSEKARHEMLITLCKDQPLMVNLCEYGDDGRGHTYDTLQSIQQIHPDHTIVFILGADKLRILPRWHHNEDLLNQFHFGIAARNNNDAQSIYQTIESIPKLEQVKDHFHIIPTTEDMSDVSSSLARKHIANKNWDKLTGILSRETIEIVKSL